MSFVEKECKFLYFVFSLSPTKGISIFENLLLPDDDHLLNEKVITGFLKLKDRGLLNQALCDKVVDSLRKVRHAVLNDSRERERLEKFVELIRNSISIDLVVAEDKLGLGERKFD